MDKLKGATALRDYATRAEMPNKVKEMLEMAILDDLDIHCIQVNCSEDYDETGEYHIVLWADSLG